MASRSRRTSDDSMEDADASSPTETTNEREEQPHEKVRRLIDTARSTHTVVRAELAHEREHGRVSAQWDIGACEAMLDRVGLSEWQQRQVKQNGRLPRDIQGWPVDLKDGKVVSLRRGEEVHRRDLR